MPKEILPVISRIEKRLALHPQSTPTGGVAGRVIPPRSVERIHQARTGLQMRMPTPLPLLAVALVSESPRPVPDADLTVADARQFAGFLQFAGYAGFAPLVSIQRPGVGVQRRRCGW